VPARKPAGVVDKLAEDIASMLAAPDLRDWFASHGADPMSVRPSYLNSRLAETR